MPKKFTKPIHPGVILLEEFLEPHGISQYRIAKDIGVPARRINEIIHGKRAISADTALRLSRYFGNSAQFWLNLQIDYDLEVAEEKLGKRLIIEVKVLKKTVLIPIQEMMGKFKGMDTNNIREKKDRTL